MNTQIVYYQNDMVSTSDNIENANACKGSYNKWVVYINLFFIFSIFLILFLSIC